VAAAEQRLPVEEGDTDGEVVAGVVEVAQEMALMVVTAVMVVMGIVF
jgi:hypothetical protein